MHKLAYGRDKHDDYYLELQGENAPAGQSLEVHEELAHLRHDLEALEKKGELPETMRTMRERLLKLESRVAPEGKAGGPG
jgi:hypothetical protein